MPIDEVGKLAQTLTLPSDGEAFEIVVIGAGGAGLYAALFAAIEGARVLVVEKTDYVGGTTALSGGTTWLPGTRHGALVNTDDTLDAAETYLTNAIGDRTNVRIRQALLHNGPRAIDHLEANSDVRFRAYPLHPDYLSELEGSTINGRALEPLPFEGRKLGALFALIRPPIPEFTVLGGMMVDRNDIFHLLRLKRSAASLAYSLKLLTRHVRDRVRHPRGTRLVMGNALVGRLLHSLTKRDVRFALSTSVAKLNVGHGKVLGVTLEQGGQRCTVYAERGVILATGGFNRDPQWRAKLLPGIEAAWCPGAPGHTGEAQRLAFAIGARHGAPTLSHAFLAPVSLRRRADGTTAVFPHFLMDRGKPGMLAVNGRGQRFVNESTSYHLFALAMIQHGAMPAYLIGDAIAVRRYGMGIVRPGGRGLRRFLDDGYLVEGRTIDELASKLSIDAKALRDTVAPFNEYGTTGVDAEFGRGSTAYQRNLGDANRGLANPCLAPLTTPPYYALRLYPGDIGAATGLVCDEHARVLDRDDHPIVGLYAVGNDMHSAMGGVYTAPGITLGPALVFAYLAARDAMQHDSRGARRHAAQASMPIR